MKLHSIVSEVFTVSGGLAGTFGTVAEAQAACAKKVGTYVIVPSTKVVVKDLDPPAVASTPAGGTGKPAMGKPVVGKPIPLAGDRVAR